MGRRMEKYSRIRVTVSRQLTVWSFGRQLRQYNIDFVIHMGIWRYMQRRFGWFIYHQGRIWFLLSAWRTDHITLCLVICSIQIHQSWNVTGLNFFHGYAYSFRAKSIFLLSFVVKITDFTFIVFFFNTPKHYCYVRTTASDCRQICMF